MIFRQLLPVVFACLILLVPLGGSANAQTIETPAGELHLGMTEDEVTQLLQGHVEEDTDSAGQLLNRRVVGKIEDLTFNAALTSKSVVYSISSYQSFPVGPVGRRAAEQAFQHYRESYGAPATPPIFSGPGVTRQSWTSSNGHSIKIELKCDETELEVSVSDNQQQLKDYDKQQHFHPDGDDLCF